MNWYLIPLSCRTVRDSSKFNLRIIISILSLVCKQLELIDYEIKIGHLSYLRTVVSFGQHNTASPAPILELVLVWVEVVEVVKEDTADQLLITTAVESDRQHRVLDLACFNETENLPIHLLDK